MEVIRKPIITEKAMRLGEQRQYVFEVDPNANKIQIKQAVEKMFEVKVASVRTVRVKGKVRRRYTKRGFMLGRTPLKKKAYVTLKEGYSIELVSGAEK
ncbi:MAG: 50S ribosomal protein L23 [Ignavibacteria bacterium]|nr:50S ribosomal protein L23 [Ignavibacteria bacterium]